jgi:hypothetical protein
MSRTIVTSVVSRIGTASTRIGSSSVATGDRPARRQPERGECEAEHLTAAITHEDGGRAVQAQVVREEAEAREADAEREHGNRVARVHGERVNCKERTGDSSERRCEPVHVVQQVERVRHSDEPEEAEHRRGNVVGDDLHADAGREDERRRGGLGRDLRERREPVDVVEQSGGKEDRAAADDPGELAGRGDQMRRERDAHGDEQPRHDPGPAEQRRRLLVPAVGAGSGDDDVRSRGTQKCPDRQQACG